MAYVSNIEREQVRAAIQQLPREFREVVLLREYEELSYQEIAAVLRIASRWFSERGKGEISHLLHSGRSKLARSCLSFSSQSITSASWVERKYEDCLDVDVGVI
jgi:DNA-directed RNA polymerase specialized sigma24 family protein